MSERKAELGDVVLWYPDGDPDASPHPAVVTQIGDDAVTLNVMGPDFRSFKVQAGVVHLSHPNARRPETCDAGAWKHTPATDRLLRLEQAIERLGKEKAKQ